MIEYEATDGPYLRWIKAAAEKVGKRSWPLLADMEYASAKAILGVKQVVLYEESTEKVRFDEIFKRDPKDPERLGLVTLVPVVYLDGGVEEVTEKALLDAADPRELGGAGGEVMAWLAWADANLPPEPAQAMQKPGGEKYARFYKRAKHRPRRRGRR